MPRRPKEFIIRPDPLDPRLTERVTGIDQTGAAIETRVTVERALSTWTWSITVGAVVGLLLGPPLHWLRGRLDAATVVAWA